MVIDSYGCTALHLICEHYTQTSLIILARLMIAKGVDANAKKYKTDRLHFIYYASTTFTTT